MLAEYLWSLSVYIAFRCNTRCLLLPPPLSPQSFVRKTLNYEEVLGGLEKKGISIRVASPKLVMEEAPESYKDVTEVVNTCHDAGISIRAVKLRPIAVIKG